MQKNVLKHYVQSIPKVTPGISMGNGDDLTYHEMMDFFMVIVGTNPMGLQYDELKNMVKFVFRFFGEVCCAFG